MDNSKNIYRVPNVDNPKVREYVLEFIKDKSDKNLTKLVNECVGKKFLVPCQIRQKDGNSIPVPLTLKDEKGNIFQPIFTCPNAIMKMPRPEAVAVFDFVMLIDIILKQKGSIIGLVIDPGENAVVFNIPLLERILANNKDKSVEANRTKVNQPVRVEDMSDEQYSAFQRNLFELQKLPKLFYEEAKELMDKISEGKNEAIDSIYEEAYDDIRRYPYLSDEFEVMVVNISELTRVIYIKMPERDTNPGTLEGVYLYENAENGEYGYFGIMSRPAGAEFSKGIIFINNDNKIKALGEAPSEGSEISYIIDYYDKK